MKNKKTEEKKPSVKKNEKFDDGEPLITDSDYFYADDPYFVKSRPPQNSFTR